MRRKKKPRAPAALAPQPPSAAELEELWAGLAPQLQACLQVGEGSGPSATPGVSVGARGDSESRPQGEVPLPEDVVPFDAASETPVEEQRAEALLRIQGCLRDAQAPEALRLLRCARYRPPPAPPCLGRAQGPGASSVPLSPREVWPEGDVFGPSGAGPSEEAQLLQEIFFAALPRESRGQILPPWQRGPGLETLCAP